MHLEWIISPQLYGVAVSCLSLCVLVCVSTWVPLLEFTKSNCTNEKAHIKQLVDACSYVMLPIVVHVLLYTIQNTKNNIQGIIFISIPYRNGSHNKFVNIYCKYYCNADPCEIELGTNKTDENIVVCWFVCFWFSSLFFVLHFNFFIIIFFMLRFSLMKLCNLHFFSNANLL